MSDIQKNISTIIEEHNLRNHLAAAAFLIAIATVFAVVWSLHLTGIAYSSADPICGKEEHLHTDECYAWVTTELEDTEEKESEEIAEGTEKITEETESITEETEEIAQATEIAETETIETQGTKTAGTEIAQETETEIAEPETAETVMAGSGEGTESLIETELEAATESVMEEVTESATEEVTESAMEDVSELETELPQPGDIKVDGDGQAYVYALICGMEEHIHTDDCYADTEESGSEDSDSSNTNEEDSSSEDTSDEEEAEESEAGIITTIVRSLLGTSNPTSGTEETETATSETSSSRTVSLQSAAGSESTVSDSTNYYLASAVDYSSGLTSGEDYIIYTQIGDSYYVVSADGNLVACSRASSLEEALTGSEGFCYIDGTGVVYVSSDFTDYSDYEWTITEGGTSGSYYVSNSATGVYLAPECDQDETISGYQAGSLTSDIGTVTVEGDFTLTYTFMDMSTGTDNWDNYIVKVVDASGNGIYVRADNYGWTVSDGNTTVLADSTDPTFGDGSSDWTAWAAALQAGSEVTVVVQVSDQNITVTTKAGGETFTATATFSDSVGTAADKAFTVSLSGEDCVLTDLSCTLVTSGGTTNPYTKLLSSSAVYTVNQKAVEFTLSGTGAMVSYSNLSAYLGTNGSTAGGDLAAAWVTSGSRPVFYFAQSVDLEYQFVDEVTLADAADNQDDGYLLYTKVYNSAAEDGYDYYVVSSENALIKCTYLGTVTDTTSTEFINSTSAVGMYCWLDSSGDVSFKYTADEQNNALGDYSWLLTSAGSCDSDGSGIYTIYNSENGLYLSPEACNSGVSETLSGTGWWDTGSVTGQDYQLNGKDADVLVFTITCTDYSSSQGIFNVEIYDTSCTYQDNTYLYYTTGTNVDTTNYGHWFSPSAVTISTDTVDTGKKSGSNPADSMTVEKGESYTVIVARADDGTTSGKTDYTVSYLDSSGNVLLSYSATDTLLNSDEVYVHVIAQLGTFEISNVTYMKANECTYTTGQVLISSASITSSYTTVSDALTDASASGSCTDKVSISGDFDVTWAFTVSSASSYSEKNNLYNYVLALTNGGTDSDSLESVYVYADTTAEASGYNSENAALDTTITYWDSSTLGSTLSDGIPTSWNTWRSVMSAGSDTTVSINIKRTGNVITVTRSVYRKGDGRSTFVTVIKDSAFDDQPVVMCLTSLMSSYTGVTLTYNTAADYDFCYYDSYAMTGSLAQGITLTAVSSGSSAFTMTAKTVDTTTYLEASGIWSHDSSAAATFYLARVRECTVHFDGTNGGLTYYSYNTDEAVSCTGMNASGKYFVAIEAPDTEWTENSGVYNNYTLNGWYDIYNDEYYLPGEILNLAYSGKNVRTVCYADWVLADADIASSAGSGTNGLDTSSFVTTQVFDYNDLFNTLSETVSATKLNASSHSELWTYQTVGNRGLAGLDSLGFLFFKASGSNSLWNPSGRGEPNSNNNNGTTQGILSTRSTLLSYLFDTEGEYAAFDTATESGVLGKNYLGEGNYLYQYISEAGYYYFDSSKNAAFYNQSEERFYLQDYTVRYNTASSSDDFLPFNYASDTTAFSDAQIDYWFGMSSEVNFYLPYASGESGNKDDEGYDLSFKFSGDDDVWVFVDDVLVLDIGGVHGVVYGEVNFATGEVIIVNKPETTCVDNSGAILYNDGTTTSNDTNEVETVVTYDTKGVLGISKYASNDTYTENYSYLSITSLSDILTAAGITSGQFDAGSHKLTIYYLERGTSESNARIYHNISADVYSLALGKVDADSTETMLSGAEFTYYMDSAFETKAKLSNTKTGKADQSTFEAGERAYGLVTGATYYVVETKAPDGYSTEGKYFTVYMNDEGLLTVTVYDTSCDLSAGKYLAKYVYNAHNTEGSEATSTDSTDTSNETAWNYILESSITGYYASATGAGTDYYTISFTIQNHKGYELPATGSMGIFPYRRAGAVLVSIAILGLLAAAFYELVWERRLRTNDNRKGDNGQTAKGRKYFAGARDRPHERNVILVHARDRPRSQQRKVASAALSPAYGGLERSRATGPGKEESSAQRG